MAIIFVVAILVFISCKFIITSNGKKKYADNYEKIVNLMFNGARDAESAGTLIHDVWSNTIYEKYSSTTDEYTLDSSGQFYDDFNTSLMTLMISDDFRSDIKEIKENQEEVQKLMKEMKNPPEEYKDAYDALKDFYEAYTKMVSYATDPSGNLSSYTEGFNDADTETLNAYKATLLYMEE